MTAEELERIAKFVMALNEAERTYRVRLDLRGSYEDKYIRVEPGLPPGGHLVTPWAGSNGDLVLERDTRAVVAAEKP